jgi:hypothetical protein
MNQLAQIQCQTSDTSFVYKIKGMKYFGFYNENVKPDIVSR